MQKGMVMQVLNKAFDVLVSEFGVVKRVYCEVCAQSDLNTMRRENNNEVLCLYRN